MVVCSQFDWFDLFFSLFSSLFFLGVFFFSIVSHICFFPGYARIIFAIWAFYYSYTDPYNFFFMYGLSAALDMADGYAARYFNQCLISFSFLFSFFLFLFFFFFFFFSTNPLPFSNRFSFWCCFGPSYRQVSLTPSAQQTTTTQQTQTHKQNLTSMQNRASTASLLVILAQFYPDYLLGFVFLNALDLVSHYARLTR